MSDERFKAPVQIGDKEARLQVLDMIRAMIEAGNVESLAILFVSKDQEGKSRVGYRTLVRAAHLDLVEDALVDMMGGLVNDYGVTPEQVRARRKKNEPKIITSTRQ